MTKVETFRNYSAGLKQTLSMADSFVDHVGVSPSQIKMAVDYIFDPIMTLVWKNSSSGDFVQVSITNSQIDWLICPTDTTGVVDICDPRSLPFDDLKLVVDEVRLLIMESEPFEPPCANW